MPDYETLPHTARRYLAVLRRQWLIVCVVPIVALAAAVAYVRSATPVYQASSKVVVGQGETLFAPGLSVDVQAFTQTISNLFDSNVVARQTIDSLHLNKTPTGLLNNLSVSSQPSGAVLNVAYTDTNQRRAVRVLTTLGNIFTYLVNTKLGGTVSAARGQATQPVSAVVFDPAHADPGTVSPKVGRTIAIALVLGLLAGVLLAIFRDALSSTIKSEAEAEAAYGAQSIGGLPRGMVGITTEELALMPNKRRAQFSEAINMLSARLRYSSSLERGLIVVTGARPEDGKTTLAAHLAAELAASGKDVIAVEADLHRPQLHRLLGQPPGQPGIRDVADSPGQVSRVLTAVHTSVSPTASNELQASAVRRGTLVAEHQEPAGEGTVGRRTGNGKAKTRRSPARFRMLPAGMRPGNAMNILSLSNVSRLFTELRDEADFLVVDTPPVLLAGESYPLLQMADAVVVVCRRGRTRHNEATRARDILHSLGIRNYSVVLSETEGNDGDYYGYVA